MADALHRGDSPYASHGLYTQPGVLDDGDHGDRTLGIEAGFVWRHVAEATVVYTDLGISTGMQYGISAALLLRNHTIEYRTLGESWETAAIEREQSFNTKWPS